MDSEKFDYLIHITAEIINIEGVITDGTERHHAIVEELRTFARRLGVEFNETEIDAGSEELT